MNQRSLFPATTAARLWSRSPAETRTAADGGLRPGPDAGDRAGCPSCLLGRPRAGTWRWIVGNDGSGEIVDYLVNEQLASGEVELRLWHAKAATGPSPAVRIKDFQEVVAQAIRSRTHLSSTTVWTTLARRLDGDEKPDAVILDGSDDAAELRRRLGLVDGEGSPWTVSFPSVRGGNRDRPTGT